MQEKIKKLQESISSRYKDNHYLQKIGKGSICLTYGEYKATCVDYLIKKKKKKDKLIFYSWLGRRSLNHNPIVEKTSFEEFTSNVIERIRKHLKEVYKEHTRILFKEKENQLFQMEVEAITKEIIPDFNAYKNNSGISIGQNVLVTKAENRKYYVQMKERLTKEKYVEFLHFYKSFVDPK